MYCLKINGDIPVDLRSEEDEDDDGEELLWFKIYLKYYIRINGLISWLEKIKIYSRFIILI